jgi:hypothetical protein
VVEAQRAHQSTELNDAAQRRQFENLIAGPQLSDLDISSNGLRLEKAMETGAVFQPELITLMKSVLEEAAASLPEAKRTSTTKADMASIILAHAAKGERDWTALKMAALSAVTDCTHYSHDISRDRRFV